MKAPLLSLLLTTSALLAAEPIVIADFEGADYAGWATTGDAFGQAPARGTLPRQMAVTGYLGKGLANSFGHGDKGTGTLTSPSTKLERRFVTFLIGGGGFQDQTCFRLKIGDKIVRSAVGPNVVPGGSEALKAAAWDITEFAGKSGVFEIVDQRTGGWGHINVDHIVLTDDRGAVPLAGAPKASAKEITRVMKIDQPYLMLPVMGREDRNRDGLENLTLESGGKVLRFQHVDLATKAEHPDLLYPYDVSEFKGKEVTLRYRSLEADALDRLQLSATAPADAAAYQGEHRPQFHFSPRHGWMNDINGTYYHDGQYHLFYQFNPTNRGSGAGYDMHWGHSVSRDLLHWEEQTIALFPDHTGNCFSGTAIVSKEGQPHLFFAATSPFSQHIATTRDGGKSWQRHPGNPVIGNIGQGDRDPKVVWHEASGHYCMVLYVGGPDSYRFFRSKDLIQWEPTSQLEHWYECPEFFPVKSAVSGEDLWLLYGCYRTETMKSNSCYQLGRFDGATFTPVGPIKDAHFGPHFYGALTFMHDPKGRQVMMGWTRGTALPPEEKFNQAASVPLELTLRNIAGADTLCIQPVAEVATLHDRPVTLPNLAKDQLCDITLELPTEKSFTLRIRGLEYGYDSATQLLSHGKSSRQLHPSAKMELRILIDRYVVETFWNQGEAATCTGSLHTDTGPALELSTQPTQAEAWSMKSIWPAAR
jgi:fructan beta-fructosidase